MNDLRQPSTVASKELFSHVPRRRGGWALVETLVLLAVVAVAIAVMSVAAGRPRSHGQLSGSLANLRELASLTASFSADRADAFPALMWRPGNYTTTFPDLRNANSELDAAANQVVDIIRRRWPVGTLGRRCRECWLNAEGLDRSRPVQRRPRLGFDAA